jgi:hypothetical protein
MSVMMFRANVKPESVPKLESAAKTVFAALEQLQPQPTGMHYAAYKLADGVSFVILLSLADDTQNPLNNVPAYREFLHRLKDWLAEPAEQDQLTVLGSYDRD